MPIYVDHDEKRSHVADVAARLIARTGVEAVTVREIAEAAGCSTAIVSHYFRSKREMLLFTYNATIERATRRCEAKLGVRDNHPKAYLEEIMPLDEERLIEWRIWIGFWAKAMNDPEIADIQRECVRRTRGAILDLLVQEDAKARLRKGVDCAQQARKLLTIIIGMAVQVVYDPDQWPSDRQHALIDGELRPLYKNAGWAALPSASRIAAE